MTTPNPLTAPELADIKAKAQAATPLPWEAQGTYVVAPQEELNLFNAQSSRDAEYICAAANAALRLVAEVERLRNRVRHLEDSLQQQTSMTDPVLGIDR